MGIQRGSSPAPAERSEQRRTSGALAGWRGCSWGLDPRPHRAGADGAAGAEEAEAAQAERKKAAGRKPGGGVVTNKD